MTRRSPRRTRLVAVGILAAFLVAWVLPAPACAGLAATQQSSCPDCPSPCCQHDCCPGVATACTASMLPAVAPPQTLYKVTTAAAIHAAMSSQPIKIEASIKPVERPPAYSPRANLNIRFCTFQE